MLLINALVLATPLAIRYLVDYLIPSLTQAAEAGHSDLTPVYLFGLVLVGIYLLQIAFSWLRDYVAGYVGASIIADIRSELFAHLETQSLRFYQSRQVGEIMSRFLNDVSRIQDLLASTLLMFVNNVLLLLGVLAYLLYDNWKLTVIAIVPVPLTILVTNLFGKSIHKTTRSLQETMAKLSARIQESLVGLKIIKAFGREEAERKTVDGIMSRLTGFFVKYSVIRSVASNGIQFVNAMGPIIVLCIGAYLVAGRSMQLGQLFAFYMYLALLYNPVQGLAGTKLEVSAAMASVDRIFEYLDIPPAVREDPTPTVIPRVRGEIDLCNVSFTYGDSGFNFENLSLHIRAGETLALVGPSGSGKTTLISLIMRFYDPESGAITIDGVDLRKLSLRSLRDNIALVDQDPLLFNATIGENIAYSNPDADRGQIIRAATIANIHDFIAGLPEGYNSTVGERGVTLSGGEKQRICLARALLKDPPILILDEATSALDSISEQLIQEALDKILADKTAIIIAHRLATVQRADRIITLRDGRIVDQGTHSELMEKSPLYRELAQKQLKI
jgi:ABC-type multidrug transport system fused ATPase/permease subunit